MAKVTPAEPETRDTLARPRDTLEQGSRPMDTLAPPGLRDDGATPSSSKSSTMTRNSWRLDSKPRRTSSRAMRRPPTLISGANEGLLRIVTDPQVTGADQRWWSSQGWYESSMAVSCRKFIRGKAFSTVTMVCLFNALFLYDTFILLQVPSNTELDVVLTLVLMVFLYEFVGLALTERTYPGGFFFWMDLIGTLSMLFDISYLLGADATSPEQVRERSAEDNVILVRAARAARLGARAGRLTRVLKILRFMPFMYVRDDQDQVKMAHAISGQLNTVLAQRVAFLTICIVVTMPIFNMFRYPESDRSFTSWAKLLAVNVEAVLASSGSAEELAVLSARLDSELRRFSDFYRDLNYGPYEVCYGVPAGDSFDCQPEPEVLTLNFGSSFEKPGRRASMREVSASNFQAFYDMSVVKAQESAANMSSIVLVVIVMLGFGMLMSNSISVVALAPLERMLSVVRGHCKQIFKFAAGIQEDTVPEDDTLTRADDNEFQLLEDVIAKLAAIVSLSTKRGEPQVTKDMREEDVVQLHWMQGGTATKTSHKSQHDSVGSVASNSLRVATSTVTVGSSNDPCVNDMDERSHPESANRASGARPRLGRSPTGIMECVSADVIASLDSAHCNVLDWGKDLQLGVCGYIITHKAGCADWVCVNVESQTLFKFISAVEQGYPPNPFHNFSHGVDVLYSVARFMQLIEAGGFFTEVTQYLLLIAGLTHDVGHLGVNNQFLMETSHELAIKYNDRSPMEMMHCAKLFHIVRDPSCDIFDKIDKNLYKEMRKHLIDGILHTDMTHHVPMVKDLGLLYQMNSDSFDRLNPGSVVNDDSPHTVQTVMNALLHCADISNPMKPWELCQRYADMVLDEFFAQGDKERELGVPLQFLNDRAKVNRPNSQVGFIEFVIAPMCEVCVQLFPQLGGLADNLGHNIKNWSDRWQAESNPEQAEIDKVTARVQKLALRFKKDLRHQGSAIVELP